MPGKLIGIAGTVADAIIAKVIADAIQEALDWCFSDYEKLAKASQERRPHVEQGDVAMARVALATQPLGSSPPCARPSVSRDERSADKVKELMCQQMLAAPEKLAKAFQERRPHVEPDDEAMARVDLATRSCGSSTPCARPSASRDKSSVDKVKGLILQDEKAWVSTDVMLSLMEKLV